jgi:hypothetical protein
MRNCVSELKAGTTAAVLSQRAQKQKAGVAAGFRRSLCWPRD